MGGYGGDTDGHEFAKQDIVAVSVNYRLGLAGYFSHPALDHENHLLRHLQHRIDKNTVVGTVQPDKVCGGGALALFAQALGKGSADALID